MDAGGVPWEALGCLAASAHDGRPLLSADAVTVEPCGWGFGSVDSKLGLGDTPKRRERNL